MNAPPLRSRLSHAGLVPLGPWELVDVVVAAAFALPATSVVINETGGSWVVLGVAVAVVLVAVPMALRRRWPVACLVATIGAALVLDLAVPRAMTVGLCAVAYTLYPVAGNRSLPVALGGLGAAVAAALATGLPDFRHLFAAGLFGVVNAVVWMVGFSVAMDRRRTADRVSRQAERAAAEVERAHALVVAQRLSIARDVHDVVAHGLSAITVQAAYARLSGPDRDARVTEALRAIETVGRQTLSDLRRVVYVLRASDESESSASDAKAAYLGPTPGLADLDGLFARAEDSGLRVHADIAAIPEEVPAGIGAAVYRTVQEALTNVVKHAATQRVSVTVHQDQDALVVEVTDHGPGGPGAPQFGYGLVGLRERALLYGGTFEAGPGPHGGFRVLSTFPVRDQSMHSPASRSDTTVAS